MKLYACSHCHIRSRQMTPRHPPLGFRRALAFQQQGASEQAVPLYRRLVHLWPHYRIAWANYGVALQEMGLLSRAAAAYRQALALAPSAAVHNNLGTLLQQQGDLSGALVCYQWALDLDSTYASGYYNQGVAFKLLGQTQAAIAAYQQAIVCQPDYGDAYLNLATLLREQGDPRALPLLEQALLAQPNLVEARWHWHLFLPVIYRDASEISFWRKRFREGLAQLIAETDLTSLEGCRQALAGAGALTNFHLAYQGLDDTDLQRQYGEFIGRILAANFPHWTQALPLKPAYPLRVGYVSSHLRTHTIAKLFLGWLTDQQANYKSQIEIFVYHIGQTQDEMTNKFKQASQHFYHLSGDIAKTAQKIRYDDLDILIYLDIGMEPKATLLAALRLAPIQAVTWGHPVTTGLSTIDYFLSCALMESSESTKYYTEQLVALPHLSINYAQPILPTLLKSRSDFGMGQNKIIYLCCQSLFKYLPQHDHLFPRIAQQVPEAQFIFIAHSLPITQIFQSRLQKKFTQWGLDSEQFCHFLPSLSQEDYFAINQLSDIYLDSVGWSGGNTTLEAIACDLPIVTWSGIFMRGRHSQAMLQILGVVDTIAEDAESYVAIAARLGQDTLWRAQVSQQTRNHASRLFNNSQGSETLVEFYQRVTKDKRGGAQI